MWNLKVAAVSILFAAMCGPRPAMAQNVPASNAEIVALSRAAEEGDQKALAQLRSLAERGEAYAQLTLGAVYTNSPGMRDFSEAAKWSLAAATQGEPIAQVNIGGAYQRGDGVEQDLGKAIFWFQMAADQGHWMGAGSLGLLYRGTRDAPVDLVQAYRWFTVASTILDETGRPELRQMIFDKREQIVRNMTVTEVADAERLAAAWKRRDWSDLEPRLDELR